MLVKNGKVLIHVLWNGTIFWRANQVQLGSYRLGIPALRYWPRFERNCRETRVRHFTTCLTHDTRSVLTATLFCFRTTFRTAADKVIPPYEGLLYIQSCLA